MIYSEISKVIEAQNHFRCIVAHTWTGSYLIKQYGAHYRKSLRIMSKVLTAIIFKTTCRQMKWKEPPQAPPCI